jgi:spore coat protein U-like protein
MTKNTKINKKILFKTTSALTCLVGAVLLFNQTGANATTSVGSMAVTTTVGNVCSVTATELTFGAYANLGVAKDSTGGGVVSTNCSGAISHVLNVTEAQDEAAGIYYLALNGMGSPGATQKITFKLYIGSAAGTQLSGTVAFATATGTGSSAAVSTLFGVIQTGNTGKESGSYTKTIALNAVYN